jgi:hypothetical protein
MVTVFDQLTDALKQQIRDGRPQQELAQELRIPQSTLSAICRGYRRLGRCTFEAILTANPPWLHDVWESSGEAAGD